MDINELLCVGRSRKSQSRTEHSTRTNRTLRRVGLHPEETLNPDDCITSSRLIPSEREDDNTTSAMYSSGYLTPPKKSILRGSPVSPKYGSPTSSIRSVRFSDRERENETIFAKLHLNETTQTDHGHVHKTHHHRSKPIICGKNRMHEELEFSDSHEIRTSTPRYGKAGETPSIESILPRKLDERQTKILSNSPKASEQKQHKEKIVIDIDITPKRCIKSPTVEGKKEQPKDAKCAKPDGHKIIQNMNFNEIMKPTDKTYVPDASNITKNMDLHCLNFNSAGTQTMSEASSPRSASPETPCHGQSFPDGSRIIRNLELNTPDTSIRMKSESIQTIDMELFEPEPKSKTVGVQTTDKETPCDALSAPENERFRSKSMQTNLDTSDTSTESQDAAGSRSVAIQTQDKIRDIPDGASITKNMDLNTSQKVVVEPKVEEVTRHVKLQHSSLNDSNWNEFVKHLEMFNPSPSSSDSETDDEFPACLKSEPVIVYDSHEHAAPVKVDTEQKRRNQSVVQHRESRGAKKLLESEEFTRQQYESVLREDGLLQKLKSSYTQARNGTVAQKSKHEKPKDESARIAKPHHAATKKPDTVEINPITRSRIQGLESSRPTSSIQTYVYRENETGTGNELSVPSDSASQRRASKDSLTFTPIETYSFNPDTLTKTTTNTGVHTLSAKGSTSRESPSNDGSLGTGVKESVTKNSYVLGVDLGPIFSTKPNASKVDHYYSGLDRYKKLNTANYGSSDHSTSRSLSPKRYMQPTVSSQASARSYGFTPSRTDNGCSYPLTSSFSSRIYTGSRPSSSSPSSRSRGHPLSSSLREMRNTAVRKSAMSSLLDPKRKSSYDYGSGKNSSNNRSSSSISGSSSHRHGTSYKSYEDYDRFTYSGSHSNPVSKHNSSKNYASSGFTEQLSATPTTREYMNALNDISNARLERSRSRSRSPKYEPVRRSYDSTSTTSSPFSKLPKSKTTFDTDKEVEMLVNKTPKDEGFVESVTTSRAHAPRRSPIVVEKHESKSDRQSRGLHRKPPLPTKYKTPRSRDSSKENGRRSRSPSNQKTESPVNTDRVKPSPVVKERIAHVSNKGSSKGDSRDGGGDVPGDGTITIGSIPSSVIDKACMFLGHETIQRIIDEAKL